MKKYFLLITLLFLVILPSQVFADDHRWYKKAKDFFTSIFPSNPKYCVNYEGEVYIVGEIFKSKNCKKGDKEFTINTSGQSGIQGPQGETGPKGDKGDKGDTGEKGDPGNPGALGAGLTGYEIITSEISLDDNLAKDVSATCSAGKKVISGGYNTLNVSDSGEVAIKASYPNTDNSWRVQGSVDAGTASTTYSLQAYAICALL